MRPKKSEGQGPEIGPSCQLISGIDQLVRLIAQSVHHYPMDAGSNRGRADRDNSILRESNNRREQWPDRDNSILRESNNRREQWLLQGTVTSGKGGQAPPEVNWALARQYACVTFTYNKGSISTLILPVAVPPTCSHRVLTSPGHFSKY